MTDLIFLDLNTGRVPRFRSEYGDASPTAFVRHNCAVTAPRKATSPPPTPRPPTPHGGVVTAHSESLSHRIPSP